MVGEIENSEDTGWKRGYHHLDDYKKGDEEEVCTQLLQIRVIYKNPHITTRFFKCGWVDEVLCNIPHTETNALT